MRTWAFEVRPWRDSRVWRRIEVAEDQTLDDLHEAIQDAFDLDRDHMYCFFMNNRAWDMWFEYGGPGVRSRFSAGDATIGSLDLRRNKRFLYLFDFGDELRHEVKVVGEGQAETAQGLPRVIGGEGTPPPQYPLAPEDGDEPADEEDDIPTRQAPLLPVDLAALAPRVAEAVLRWQEAEGYYPADDIDGEEWDDDVELEPDGEAEPPTPLTPEEAAGQYETAMALLDGAGGSIETAWAVFDVANVDEGGWWLGGLAQTLMECGKREEAANLATRVVDLTSASSVRHELPWILAEAGRREEALAQLAANLNEYPDDPAMLLCAGKAYLVLGDPENAELLLRESLKWAGNHMEQRHAACAVLNEMFASAGRDDAIDQLGRDEKAFRADLDKVVARSRGIEITVRRDGPKIGRNDPCPCGSGKKYKKCCLGKEK